MMENDFNLSLEGLSSHNPSSDKEQDEDVEIEKNMKIFLENEKSEEKEFEPRLGMKIKRNRSAFNHFVKHFVKIWINLERRFS